MGNSDYNFVSKLFHRISLGSKFISEISFDLDQLVFKPKNASSRNERHVFISGLARSGTTALMQILHNTGQFSSLTYSDLPFVLAPNLNQQISGKRASELKERAHQDGIFINQESPEALEEVFWKVFLKDKYIKEDRLISIPIPTNILEKYVNYIDSIIFKTTNKSNRYLSKNNNSILRLDAIQSRFPNAIYIIPFRNPIEHALSLLNQHIHFCEVQKKDSFSLDFMNWLGHHEFGLNHKPFDVGNDLLFDQLKRFQKQNINYWLLLWLNYYSYALKEYSEACVFFCYESFCEVPEKSLHQLLDKIGVEASDFKEINYFTPKIREVEGIDEQILQSCMKIYSEMKSLSEILYKKKWMPG